MSDLSLALHALLSRKIVSLLSVLLTAFGVMMALVVLQFAAAAQQRIDRDGKGVDIVIGAKGSPLQLVLSALYHADIPTGNIPYTEAEKWMHHPQVKQAIPLALGDNWKGFRIVGTTADYAAHYGAKPAQGQLWEAEFEAVAGAGTGLALGQTFSGAHGLGADGHSHDHQLYKVVGVLGPTGSVIDRLILTSVNSVLALHGQETTPAHEEHGDHDDHHHHHHDDDDHDHEHHHDHSEPAKQPAEITALLVKTRSPLANINLPRSINRDSMLQAANPALEMTRLSAVFGLGTRSMGYISAFLIGMAALSIFAGIAGSLDSRSGDLAVLRALGYGRHRLFGLLLMEGLALTAGGLALGFVMGVAGFVLLAPAIPALGAQALQPDIHWLWLALTVLVAGLAASLLPALRAARADPAQLLSQR
ncbi:MAG: FtsX-like permease family protein [Alphaproteobacteria bacterium]|nr:FtsX-like permease family protein [Alphaproteobacteria bacterium]